MNALPANISEARLPQTYEAAKGALATCERVDECKDWADKAAALASYAKQAKDEQLEIMARRIRLRAIERGGELLKAIDRPSQGGRPKNGGDGSPVLTRKALILMNRLQRVLSIVEGAR